MTDNQPDSSPTQLDGTEDASPTGTITIQDEMQRSFLDYAMSVIISRALPDARDGLKPVHRRILWSMYDQGFRPDKGYVKCARVVGDVMARFHPHGDSAIYDALARMAQPFSLQHPLIDFHGNYGSPEDPPAASRYTECRLDNLALSMLSDISEDTIDFVDNYSGDFPEPSVLPSRLPNLLVNGSQGIAVGMATSIPPHNLEEIVRAVVQLLETPDTDNETLMKFVKGPDFPTGGHILGTDGAESAYRTGRGTVKIRATVEREETNGTTRLVVTALPYQTSVSNIARKIADLVNADTLEGIRSINDESAGDDTRFVITLKQNANPDVVLNNLWKYTQLQSSFSMNMIALVNGVPRTLTLKDALVAYVDHQIDVVTRRSQYRLKAAKDRLHIIEGLLKALTDIDAVIKIIRESQNTSEARAALIDRPFDFSETQANHILDMALGRLTKLGSSSLEIEQAERQTTVEELEVLLADEYALRMLVRDELTSISEKFSTPRRTTLETDPGVLDIEDLINDTELVFTMSASGYVKTVPTEEFRAQGRGGRGITGTKVKTEDNVMHLLHTTAHSYLLFFSNHGRVHRKKAHEIPVGSRTSKGNSIVNLLDLQENEHIQAVIDARDYETNSYLFFATARGRVKRTKFTDYDSSRKAGLIAIKLDEDDELVDVLPTDGDKDILLSSQFGQVIRFPEKEVREMGRIAGGVIGWKIKHPNDSVVSCSIAEPGAFILHVSSKGFGKRTAEEQYRSYKRGSQGHTGIKISKNRGEIIGALVVYPEDQILAITHKGVLIRIPVSDISEQKRNSTGVKVMTPDRGDKVVAITRINEEMADSETENEPDDANNSLEPYESK